MKSNLTVLDTGGGREDQHTMIQCSTLVSDSDRMKREVTWGGPVHSLCFHVVLGKNNVIKSHSLLVPDSEGVFLQREKMYPLARHDLANQRLGREIHDLTPPNLSFIFVDFS